MKKEIDAYGKAFEAHHQATRESISANLRVKKTRHALQIARDELRAKERDMLEDAEREESNKQ